MDKIWREWATKRGYRLAFGDPAVVNEVHAEIERRMVAGEIDKMFYEKELSSFRYLDTPELRTVRTVIVLAVPRPAHRVVFESNDGALEAVVPPTYAWYTQTLEQIQKALVSSLLGKRDSLVPLAAPLKLTAARLGLVTYGRNNITYVPGFGSYHQLMGFLTDAELGPISERRGRTPAVAPECERCQACRQACPTGAIGDDRFLLHAERCLTLCNEFPDPWPAWLPPSVHHCLVGCLICQRVCPQNAGLLRFEPANASFTPEETARIMAEEGGAGDPLWEGIRTKLASAGLPGYEEIIGRNLRALRASGGSQ